ncbi:MAG TPA: PEP-CTERM sorting domain-containing protein [Verrucomicrobiota bacterium]|nr:PEP-CTERM sorting domain-containing protein [Verrucomicrobiota bacterium]
MKKLILAAVAVTCAVSVYAQGTVIFNNRTQIGTSHVWGPSSIDPTLALRGNAPTGDTPAGTTDYAANGMSLLAGSRYSAQIFGLVGADQPEESLIPLSNLTSFRTGTAVGFLAITTATLAGIPIDTPMATLQLVVWDNANGLYPTWAEALPAWQNGIIPAGKGAPFNTLIGGLMIQPPNLPFTSFNIYFIPEPGSFALLGLGAAALLIFRRRK